MKALAYQVSGEDHLPGSQTDTLSSHGKEREKVGERERDREERERGREGKYEQSGQIC